MGPAGLGPQSIGDNSELHPGGAVAGDAADEVVRAFLEVKPGGAGRRRRRVRRAAHFAAPVL